MTTTFRVIAAASLLLLASCEVPAAWKGSSRNEPDTPAQLGAGPTRNPCGDGDASCDIPLGRYTIRYTFISGTCGDEGGETGVRFNEDSEEAETFPCEDHEVSMTSDNALFLDRECTLIDPLSGAILRRTRAQATIRGPHANGELTGDMDLTVIQGPDAPCTARYSLRGTRE